jgi:hypothetical protein
MAARMFSVIGARGATRQSMKPVHKPRWIATRPLGARNDGENSIFLCNPCRGGFETRPYRRTRRNTLTGGGAAGAANAPLTPL